MRCRSPSTRRDTTSCSPWWRSAWIEQRRDQQRLLHHRSVHGVLSFVRCVWGSGQRRGGLAGGARPARRRDPVGGIAAPGEQESERGERCRRPASRPGPASVLQASDSTPAMKGPAARPNRFWNSASTEEPVARTPGWMTSMHDRRHRADGAGGDQKPPSRISANWRVGGERDAEALGAEGEAEHQHRDACTAAPSRRACGPGCARRRGRPPRPRPSLPAAPASTTSAAFSRRLVGAMPCTRLRKLGSQTTSPETTISCAAPADADPQHGARAGQHLDDVRCAASPSDWRVASARPASRSTVRVVAHLQVQQRQHQARDADDAEGRLPAPACRRSRRRASRPAPSRPEAEAEAGQQRAAHARREVARDQRRADRAVAGLAQADRPRARRAAGRSCASTCTRSSPGSRAWP